MNIMLSDINKVVSSDKTTSIKKNSLEFFEDKKMQIKGEINFIDSEIKKKGEINFIDSEIKKKGEINLIDSEIKKKSLEFLELKQSIKKYDIETDENTISMKREPTISTNQENSMKPVLIDFSKEIMGSGKKINIFELSFFSPKASKDSKYLKNLILNASINIFKFNGSTSPLKIQIFDIEFKSPPNIYDNKGDIISKSDIMMISDLRDINVKQLFKDFAKENMYNNVVYLNNPHKNVSITLDETSPINFIFVENMEGIMKIKTRLPINVIAFNSNFKLQYTFENINILEYSELVLINSDSKSKDCPKQSCPECSKQQCPKCIKEDCPKQSCPECSKQQCPECSKQQCPECSKQQCPECIKEKCPECSKQQCPECSKQQCPECIKEKCSECPSNIGWISATTALLIFSIILFSLCLYLKNKEN
jgi:hypothetical protein